MTELKGKQRRHLRALGHHLKPVAMIGKSGLTGAVLRQIDVALEDHELIKIRFGRAFEGENETALREILERTGSAAAGSVGGTALLYRRRAEDPQIELP